MELTQKSRQSASIDERVPRTAVQVAQQFAPIPQPSAMPCTVTVGAQSNATTSGIASPRAAASGFFCTYAPNDLTRFTYLGSEPTVPGGSFPDDRAASFNYVDGVAGGLASAIAESQHTGRYYEAVVKCYPAGITYWVWVDGRPLTIKPVTFDGTGFAYILLDFGSTTGVRKIQIRLQGTKFFGVNVGTTDRIVATTKYGPRVACIADSYWGGASGVGTLSTAPAFLREHLQVPDLWNFSQGGTGYLAPGGTSKARDRISQIISRVPDVVLIALGHNDENSTLYPRASLTTEVDAYLTALRAGLPNAQIVVAGPLTQGGGTASYQSVQDAIFAGVDAADVDAIKLDTLNPNPFTGTGEADTPMYDGNSDLFIDADGVHPTQDGHAWLGWWFALKLRPLLLKGRFNETAPPALNIGVPFSDDFNRADSATTLGARWSFPFGGPFGISSNKAYIAGGSGVFNPAVYDAEVPDVSMQFKVAGATPAQQGLCWRQTGATSYYGLNLGDGVSTVKISKYVSGAYTLLGSASVTVVTNDIIKVTVVGSTFTVYRNDTQILQVTGDTTFATATKHGLWCFGTDSAANRAWDDFMITAI